jgi:hypothetical protein
MAFITTNPSPFIVNIPELQNVITSATGLDGTLTVTDLAQYINATNATLSANNLGTFNTETITVLNTLNLTGDSAIAYDGSNVLTSNTIGSIDDVLSFQTEGITRAQINNAGEFIIPTIETSNAFISGTLYISSLGVVAAAPIGDIYADGDVYARGIFYPSDEILKTDIHPYKLVGELPDPIKFKWKNTGESDIGVLAASVEAIEPHCVSIRGNDGYKTVDYAKLTVLLLAEVKQLKKELQEVRELLHQ